MSDFKTLGTAPMQLPTYTWQVLHNCAREASVSPIALAANILASLASQPSFLQDVLDSSDFYQKKLRGTNDE